MSKEKVDNKTFRKYIIDLFAGKSHFKEALNDFSEIFISFLSLSKRKIQIPLDKIHDSEDFAFDKLDKEFQDILKEEFAGTIEDFKKKIKSKK